MTQSPSPDEAAALFAALPADVQPLALAALQRLNNRNQYTGAFGWLLGIHYIQRGDGTAICELEVDASLWNPGKVAHGGVLYSLVDSAMGAAVFTALPPGWGCLTAELKLNYLRPVRQGRAIASAQVVHRGRTLAIVTGEVRDADDVLLGIAQGTFAVFPREGRG